MSIHAQQSARLALPYIQEAQAQKHVTHNEAIRRLDELVQIGVEGVADAPPADPADTERWIVGDAPSGGFEGHAGELALREGVGAGGWWRFEAPAPGWVAWDASAGTLRVWDGAAWTAAGGAGDRVERIGVGADADDVNRLAVASEAVLLTHAGAGTQLKLNKAAEGDTASLLFQTGWSGRAEMGTAGTDGFAVKVSADGAAWREALVADPATGAVRFPNGVAGAAPAAFGADAPLTTTAYALARGTDMVTNGTGLLGNAYNFPGLTFDATEAPGLPGAFVHRGHFPGTLESEEAIALDPSRAYALSAALHQDRVDGDWSAHADGASHRHYVGLVCYDIDGLRITAPNHARYRHGGQDSLTVLASPMTPGDTEIRVADASGWNESNASAARRGVIVFGYRSAGGALQRDYSRHVATDLFDLGGVDKATGTISLRGPVPAALGNPDHPAGTWPAGTPVANSSSGRSYKYTAVSGVPLPEVGRWFRAAGVIGGTDRSGGNENHNFPPGTASVRLLIMPNYSNAEGGADGYPDTGADHAVRFAGLSLTPVQGAALRAAADGSVDVKVPVSDFDAGTVALGVPSATLEPL
ncbi:DUF2793 domain-containing protein [Jannaschia sp. Os4]|uniref:DUF2793 domain-containing protein n=1 Tax=Jannaschia sp. Os4 TaxID=2807617 RepID=UPI00193938A8|nr:DUF2793 domain-containing protein [Jannaschia sp. Os4]MBM2575465.1 DUF2793 domain-containing protein [Jannaschia sp. Os4]